MSGTLYLYSCLECHLVFTERKEDCLCPYCKGWVTELGKVEMVSEDDE